MKVRAGQRPGAALSAIAAFFAYQAVSIGLFGRSVIFQLSTLRAGAGPDPQLHIWFLVWWPYSILGHLNPLFTNLIWAPEGFNVAWSTSIALQSIIAAPITIRFGPVVAFNLLNLVLPALTACSAFVLIRHIVGHSWPALLGGYLFGFSPMLVGQQAATHMSMTAAFCIPAAVLIVLLRFEDKIRSTAFTALLALVFACQFLLGMEIFATTMLFGAIALGAAYLLWPHWRKRTESITVLALAALGAAAVVVSPFLLFALRGSGMGLHAFWPVLDGGDLVELLVPTNRFALGGLPGLGAISSRYAHTANNTGGYVGVPLLLVAIAYIKSRWNVTATRFLTLMIAIVYVATLGARLHVDGHVLFGLPWELFAKLPFLNSAIPARFSIYLDLMLAIIASAWIAEINWSATAKWLAAIAIVASVLPSLNTSLWARGLDTPEFFTAGTYRQYLQPGEVVLALPFGGAGNAMTWQALSAMYFRMADGWTGPPPRSFREWPIIGAFERGTEIPEESQQLYAFLATHDVSAVLIDPNDPKAPAWQAMLQAQGARVEEVKGVIIARPSSASLDPYRKATALEMECRMELAQFEQLVGAADKYLAGGYPLAQLTPLAAQNKGLLPANWVKEGDGGIFTSAGLWLGPWANSRVSVGVNASSGCVAPIASRYVQYAEETYFPYPRPLRGPVPGDIFQRKFVMVFARDSIAKAAASAKSRAAVISSFAVL